MSKLSNMVLTYRVSKESNIDFIYGMLKKSNIFLMYRVSKQSNIVPNYRVYSVHSTHHLRIVLIFRVSKCPGSNAISNEAYLLFFELS